MLFSPGKVPAAEGSFSGEGLDLQSISILFPAAKEIGGRIDTFAASASGPVNALSGTAELRYREISQF